MAMKLVLPPPEVPVTFSKQICEEPDVLCAISIDETDQIKSLNNKFVSLIDKVRLLEQQNCVLCTKLNLLRAQGIKNVASDSQLLYKDYINALQRQLDQLGNDNLHLDSKSRQSEEIVNNFRSKYEEEVNKHTALKNTFAELKRGVDAGYMDKVELEAKIQSLTDEINSLTLIYEEELAQMQTETSDTVVSLSMDNNRHLDLDGIIALMKSQFEKIVNYSHVEAESLYQTKYEELQGHSQTHSDELRKKKVEISELNLMIKRLNSEINILKNQCAKLQTAIAETEQHGELTVKGAKQQVHELEAALQKAKQDMARQLMEFQELMNVKLALDIEIATYRKLLEVEENKFSGENAEILDISVNWGANGTGQAKRGGIEHHTGSGYGDGYGFKGNAFKNI
ncbi:keratin, type II cytoskeletal 6A [Xenopus laevis]|uniref:Keratin, type II cytoskeletal 6A n=1 Tax=Xenopus laevis TaxID=8355 RepID=A0A8J1MA00_XENLA|nr:keratin, type II cytoskeletal 6A [Xenopus laevis]